MHISDGVLSAPVLATTAAAAAAGVAVGLKKIDSRHIAETGVLSAAFFVASLVRVPIGPSSVHLILNGLLGIILGWAAFPAIAVALLLQALFFQYGGITSLGANILIMAGPAIICYGLFGKMARSPERPRYMAAGFLCGFCAVALASLIAAASLALTGEALIPNAIALAGAHLPVMMVEGLITAFLVGFLRKVQPELLGRGPERPAGAGDTEDA